MARHRRALGGAGGPRHRRCPAAGSRRASRRRTGPLRGPSPRSPMVPAASKVPPSSGWPGENDGALVEDLVARTRGRHAHRATRSTGLAAGRAPATSRRDRAPRGCARGVIRTSPQPRRAPPGASQSTLSLPLASGFELRRDGPCGVRTGQGHREGFRYAGQCLPAHPREPRRAGRRLLHRGGGRPAARPCEPPCGLCPARSRR